MRRVVFVSAILAFLLIPSATVTATSIQFQVTDLPDSPAGDLWQYDYFLSDSNLLATQGFAVFFDETLYSNISELPPTPVNWFPVVAQPIPALASEGYYDALAIVDHPPFTGPFSMKFVWLGQPGTKPGSQPFEIYQLDAQGAPVAFDEGTTTPLGIPAGSVPEPSSLLLIASGVAAGRVLRKHRSQSDGSSGAHSRSSRLAETSRLD